MINGNKKLDDAPDTLRQLNELAVAWGRSKQSPRTGLVHYHEHAQGIEERETIPLLENFLFALALLRTRTAEGVTEAKTILERLLHFGTWDSSHLQLNFPTYIHEFPQCRDYYLPSHLLPVFYWILKHFQQVLGHELKQKLESSSLGLIEQGLALQQMKKIPRTIAFKMGASIQAFGELLSLPDLTQQGKTAIAAFQRESQENPAAYWNTPESFSHTLIALQMLNQEHSSKSSWGHFWQWLSQTWHPKILSYIGPVFHEMQTGSEPQATLYDLFLGYFGGSFSSRTLTSNPSHIYASLIQNGGNDWQESPSPLFLEGEVQGLPWMIQKEEDYAWSVLQRNKPYDPVSQKGMSAFRLVWGDSKRVHTLLCHSGNASQIIGERIDGQEVALTFALTDLPQFEEKEKQQEISFFVDGHEALAFLVNGKASNTFQLGDEVTLTSDACNLKLRFTLAPESKGNYFGHLMRGNRPSQLSLKGENRFQAYDVQLFLRALRRETPCFVKVQIQLRKYE